MAIAIDVLRATSSMVIALAEGAESIIPVSNLEEARKLKAENPNLLLAGERESLKPPDFDLGNSPYDFKGIHGKEIIMTTSNGTKLIELLKESKQLYIASFLNVKSVANEVATAGYDKVGIGCAGNRESVALEDVLCAGALVENLISVTENADLTDAAKLALDEYITHGKDLERVLSTIASHGKTLMRKGFVKDVVLCAKINMFSVVPAYIKGKIVRNDT